MQPIKTCTICLQKKRLRFLKWPAVCAALASLAEDTDFLAQGDVFTEDMISAYIELKMEDVYRVEHDSPAEFDNNYSLPFPAVQKAA